jgi:hypothetical protein
MLSRRVPAHLHATVRVPNHLERYAERCSKVDLSVSALDCIADASECFMVRLHAAHP